MKHCFVALFAVAIASAVFAQEEEGTASAKGAQVNTTGKGYSAAYVIEPASKRVLLEENAHVPLPTASMAKMMTCIVAMEQIQSGQLKLDTPVTCSARASKIGGGTLGGCGDDTDASAFRVETNAGHAILSSLSGVFRNDLHRIIPIDR